jgi:hypothetical protein
MKRLIIVALAIMASAFASHAATITTCGASSGTAYFFEGGLVSKKRAGWQADTIKDGRFSLIADGAELDIVYTDATGGTKSATGDGAKVLSFGGEFPIVIAEIYPNPAGPVITVYAFAIDKVGNGKVLWTMTRSTGLINKVSIFEATCAGQGQKVFKQERLLQ